MKLIRYDIETIIYERIHALIYKHLISDIISRVITKISNRSLQFFHQTWGNISKELKDHEISKKSSSGSSLGSSP